MWISVVLEPFLFLHASGCPPAAALPPGVVVPHALRTTTAAVTSAPSLVSLIQSPPKTVVRKPPERPRSVLPPPRPGPRSTHQPDAQCPISTVGLADGSSEILESERRCVTDDGAERWLGRRAGCR